METKNMEDLIKEFKEENPDIIEAMNTLAISTKEYIEALDTIYGTKKITLTSTNS